MAEHEQIPDVVLDSWERRATDPAELMEIARLRQERATKSNPVDQVAAIVFGEGYTSEQRARVKRALFPLLYGGDQLTSEPALAAFREAWQQADAEGATGDRVRRGMAAAIEAVS
jgi:hypothetical protein